MADARPDGVFPSPLRLLLRVNLLQGWRRILAIRQQSRLLTLLIGIFLAGYFGLAFLLFYKGLRFAGTFPGLGTLLTERLLYLLFAFLFMLLLFSNLVISYTNFFRNREAAFLLSLPIPTQSVFRWKFIEACLLASWAFLFLVAPLLAAFGLTRDVAWHFYAFTLVLLALFIVLPGVAGAWLAIQIARFMDRRLFQVSIVVGLAILLPVGAYFMRPEPITEEMLETRVLAVLDQMLAKTRFAMFPLLPSYWLSAGVMNWAEGVFTSSVFFALMLLSYALLFGALSFTRLGRVFFEATSAVQSRESVFGRWTWLRHWREQRPQTRRGSGLLERLVRLVPLVGPDIRALLVKDARMFWRDTSQWGQTLVLFGLLGVYVLNLRHFTQQLTSPFWVHLVSFLNLGACSLNLATLTTRFVYPQFSLEGKRLWIVGMAPLGLPKVVITKFWMATGASLSVTLGLIIFSCQMLQMPWERTLFFAGAITAMTLTLNGLAIGLGVLYPNFKEDNPGKIVSGFGGTFCLVLSFLYIVGSIALLAIGSPLPRSVPTPAPLLVLGLGGFTVLSLALGWLPMSVALRRLRHFEQ